MYVFVIEPKGRLFEKIKLKYDTYVDGGIYLPFRPYYLYRVNEFFSIQDIRVAEILIPKDDFTQPPLFRYTNEYNEYFEVVTLREVAILRNLLYPCCYIQGTNIPIGSMIAFFFFLALEDSNGRIVKKTVWNIDEMKDIKEVIFTFLMEKLYKLHKRARWN